MASLLTVRKYLSYRLGSAISASWSWCKFEGHLVKNELDSGAKLTVWSAISTLGVFKNDQYAIWWHR